MRHRAVLCIALALLGALVLSHAHAKGAASGSAPRITKVTVSRPPASSDPSGSGDGNTSPRSRHGERSSPATASDRHREADRKASRYLLAQQARARAREQEEVAARADRLYRASQVSAPIIVDAKACRRVGAHGESIYENCGVAAANPPAR